MNVHTTIYRSLQKCTLLNHSIKRLNPVKMSGYLLLDLFSVSPWSDVSL